jgi:hypothetical protein
VNAHAGVLLLVASRYQGLAVVGRTGRVCGPYSGWCMHVGLRFGPSRLCFMSRGSACHWVILFVTHGACVMAGRASVAAPLQRQPVLQLTNHPPREAAHQAEATCAAVDTQVGSLTGDDCLRCSRPPAVLPPWHSGYFLGTSRLFARCGVVLRCAASACMHACQPVRSGCMGCRTFAVLPEASACNTLTHTNARRVCGGRDGQRFAWPCLVYPYRRSQAATLLHTHWGLPCWWYPEHLPGWKEAVCILFDRLPMPTPHSCRSVPLSLLCRCVLLLAYHMLVGRWLLVCSMRCLPDSVQHRQQFCLHHALSAPNLLPVLMPAASSVAGTCQPAAAPAGRMWGPPACGQTRELCPAMWARCCNTLGGCCPRSMAAGLLTYCGGTGRCPSKFDGGAGRSPMGGACPTQAHGGCATSGRGSFCRVRGAAVLLQQVCYLQVIPWLHVACRWTAVPAGRHPMGLSTGPLTANGLPGSHAATALLLSRTARPMHVRCSVQRGCRCLLSGCTATGLSTLNAMHCMDALCVRMSSGCRSVTAWACPAVAASGAGATSTSPTSSGSVTCVVGAQSLPVVQVHVADTWKGHRAPCFGRLHAVGHQCIAVWSEWPAHFVE